MKNEYGNAAYAKTIADMKVRLRDVRARLDETDEKRPELQAISDRHWSD